MHELALAQSIVQTLEEQSAQKNYQQVKQVWLEIGALACIEKQALLFGLEIASRDTLAEGAQYHIRIQPADGWCLACSQDFTVMEYASPCPHCGSSQIQVDKGTEMRLCEMEVI